MSQYSLQVIKFFKFQIRYSCSNLHGRIENEIYENDTLIVSLKETIRISKHFPMKNLLISKLCKVLMF